MEAATNGVDPLGGSRLSRPSKADTASVSLPIAVKPFHCRSNNVSPRGFLRFTLSGPSRTTGHETALPSRKDNSNMTFGAFMKLRREILSRLSSSEKADGGLNLLNAFSNFSWSRQRRNDHLSDRLRHLCERASFHTQCNGTILTV